METISRDPVSLETPVGRDRESALGDLIENRSVGLPVDAIIGSGCECEHTLEEIGQEFTSS